VALIEILHVSEGVHDLILKHASAREIRDFALHHGMRSLQACGWEQVKRGITGLNEVMEFAEILDDEETAKAQVTVGEAEADAAKAAEAKSAEGAAAETTPEPAKK
jgi:hypothetical protein